MNGNAVVSQISRSTITTYQDLEGIMAKRIDWPWNVTFQFSRNFAELLLAEQRYFKGMKDMGCHGFLLSQHVEGATRLCCKQWWRHSMAGSLYPKNTEESCEPCL